MSLVNSRIRCLIIAFLCLSSPSVWAQTIHEIEVGAFFFEPNFLVIEAGDTVRWINRGSFHDVVADDNSFASEQSTNWTFERTFDVTGIVPFHCSIHSVPGGTFQNGVLRVVDGTNDFMINAGLNDAWLNTETLGQGFFITVFPEISSIFLAWFTYDTERPDESVTANLGEPGHRWLTAFGPYSGGTSVLSVEVTSGGVFDSPTPEVEQTGDGTIVLDFFGCNDGLITYNIPSANLAGFVPIERIASDNIAACEDLATQ